MAVDCWFRGRHSCRATAWRFLKHVRRDGGVEYKEADAGGGTAGSGSAVPPRPLPPRLCCNSSAKDDDPGKTPSSSGLITAESGPGQRQRRQPHHRAAAAAAHQRHPRCRPGDTRVAKRGRLSGPAVPHVHPQGDGEPGDAPPCQVLPGRWLQEAMTTLLGQEMCRPRSLPDDAATRLPPRTAITVGKRRVRNDESDMKLTM